MCLNNALLFWTVIKIIEICEMWSHFSVFSYFVFASLLILSIISWYLIFAKSLEIFIFKKDFIRVKKKWRGLIGFGAISSYVQNDKSPLINLMVVGAFEWAKINMTQLKDSQKEDLLSGVFTHELMVIKQKLSSGQTILALIAAVAPFIGLLGTVVGIYQTLTSLTLAGDLSLAVISDAVGETLIMTAFGLIVAIPAVFAYNLIAKNIEVCCQNIDDLARVYHTLIVYKIKSDGL